MATVRIQPERHTLDIQIYRGDDMENFAVVLTYPGFVPIDKADWTVLAQIRPAPDGEVLKVITTTLADSGDDADLTTDKLRIYFTMDAAETAALTFSKAVWDLHIEDPNGVVYTPLVGNVTVTKDVTIP